MDLSPFDPVIKAAQRMSGDIGVIFYEEMNMLVFFVDTDTGLLLVHKILITDQSNFTSDMVAYHIPQIKTGLERLKKMRATQRKEYEKVNGGVNLNTKAGHKF